MSFKQKIVGVLLAIAALFSGGYVSNNLGSVGGLNSTVATSTFQAVTANTVELLFATSTSCSARIISTQSGPIKLTFSDITGQVPTGLNGFAQAASTTVSYDAEIFGCNAVRVYPFTSENLTILESR